MSDHSIGRKEVMPRKTEIRLNGNRIETPQPRWRFKENDPAIERRKDHVNVKGTGTLVCPG
jgi:hypothetical protein